MKFFITCQYKFILVFLKLFLISSINCVIHWDNSVNLDDDFRLLWRIDSENITFEVQVKTLGYFGLGFSNDGKFAGSDLVIGWYSQGQAYYQDRHVLKNGDLEPVIDISQDYILLLGYENATHTVMRFKRKLETCDFLSDIPITGDTMRVIYMYHDHEPLYGSIIPGSLPDPQLAFKGYRPLLMLQTVHPFIDPDGNVKILELRNQDAVLPTADEVIHWCKMFKLQDMTEKNHVIKYEPVFDTTSTLTYMQHLILYECQGATPELELMSREQGKACAKLNKPRFTCNSIVATWTKGSEGFVFPPEAGYALDTNQTRFYLMETHYANPKTNDDTIKSNVRQKADNSGIKLFYTNNLRKHDAGVLSVGLESSWRHIIPPYQTRVTSEGHCIEDCTRRAFRQPLSVFAVMMRATAIGREIKLRHIRKNTELAPIASDNNIESDYQEYRRIPVSEPILPGDRLIAECVYDSSNRDQITLGGLTNREETCIILTYYYPRQKRLTTCHSIPSLPTVLHSLGIQAIVERSNPVRIKSPPSLADTHLEDRLVHYDWRNQYDNFHQVTRAGSFEVICWDAKNVIMTGIRKEAYNPNITQPWKPATVIKQQCKMFTENGNNPSDGNTISSIDSANTGLINTDHHQIIHEDENNNIIEGAARTKVSRSSATETMGFSGTVGLYKASIVRPLLRLSMFIFVLKLIL